jgi:Uma2 family endonuclease
MGQRGARLRTTMATVMKLLTAEEYQELPGLDRTELIDGVVVETMPGAEEHAAIASTIVWLLNNVVRPQRLGTVFTEAGFIIRRQPDTVRAPDVAFITADRMPASGPPRRFRDLAPDLAVEVVSPNDRPGEVLTKAREWMEAGVRLLWIVYPEQRQVVVVRSAEHREVLSADDVIDGGEVLPGFSCRVAELFE